jgi:hypothetical protein
MFGNVRISSPRREVKESCSSVQVLTELSVVPEDKAAKTRVASMEQNGRDWSVSVSTVSLSFATLITAEPGRLPHYLLFDTAAALAVLSTMILFLTRIRTFTSMRRSWREDHKLRIIRSLIRQRRNNAAACCTRETHAVLPGVNPKTAQEHDYPRERASAPARDYLD